MAAFSYLVSGQLAHAPKCNDFIFMMLVLSTSHVMMDFILLLAPIIVLWKVNMAWSAKGRLYLVFSTGAMSCIGSILRQMAQTTMNLDSTCK